MAVVVATFPHHKFVPWKFVQVSRLWWSVKANQKVYMSWLQDELKIKSMENWYDVTIDIILKHRGTQADWVLGFFLFCFGGNTSWKSIPARDS